DQEHAEDDVSGRRHLSLRCAREKFLHGRLARRDEDLTFENVKDPSQRGDRQHQPLVAGNAGVPAVAVNVLCHSSLVPGHWQGTSDNGQRTRDMTVVRFGLIGFGAWGGHHARAIAETPGAELVAIAARSAATCAAAREAFPNAHVYDDYRALLDREQLDVVDIVLPSHLHHEVAAAVLSSGRHLLME